MSWVTGDLVRGSHLVFTGTVLDRQSELEDGRIVTKNTLLVEEAIKRIAAAGKTPGCIAADSQRARRYVDLGVRYMATHAIKLMVNGSRQFIEEVRS